MTLTTRTFVGRGELDDLRHFLLDGFLRKSAVGRFAPYGLLVLLTLGWSPVWGDQPAFVGRSSCAATACHGNVSGRGPAWNHSLSTWLAEDPHAAAGDVLRNETSRTIVVRLNPIAKTSEATFDSVLRSRCISCHTMATPEQCQLSGPIDAALLSAGVSCEACHGAARNWLDAHLRFDWAGPQRFEPETGMLDTESIIGRAENCVRCHIGSRSADGLVRDMNHDLIAAGHPALRFDLLIYNENLPKHWTNNSESARAFDQSAIRTRDVSRSIGLASAAMLAAERASAHLAQPAGDAPVPWPEFGDYDCFACHQSLSIGEYHLPPRDSTKSPLHVSNGLPVWNSWYSVGQLELRDNTDLLEKLSPHRSDPKVIAASGRSLAAKYQRVASERLSSTVDPSSVIAEVRDQLQASPPVNWHQAAVQYLRLDAAGRDLANAGTTESIARSVRSAIESAERHLRFNQGRQTGDATIYHSPKNFDAEKYRQAILAALNP